MSEPTWLDDQSEEPFQAGALHPSRPTWLCSRAEIKRCADAEKCRRRNAAYMSCHPFLLLRHPEPDPDKVGSRFVDGGHIDGILFFS